MKMPFHTLAKILDLDLPSEALIEGYAIDSRFVKRGDLFFALTGQKSDGHTFLKEVAKRGAVGAVVSTDYRGHDFGMPLLRVPHVLDALQRLSKRVLESRHSKVVGITGSIGKTTTKDFVAALLKTSYKVFATPRSYNSQATLPLCILMADGDEDFLVLEMSMSEPGNLAKLIDIAPPDVALLTTIAKQHTVGFSDGLKGVCREKAVIFSSSKTRLGLCNADIPHFDEVVATGTCPKLLFSTAKRDVDFYLEPCEAGVRVFQRGEDPVDIPLNLPVKAHYQNFLAAVACARSLGISWEAIETTAPSLRLPPMRFERVEKQGITFINDAFNAGPDSLKAALESLPKPQAGGKTIAVISEMNALGEYSDEGHHLIGTVALAHVDHLLCLGSRCAVMERIFAGKKPCRRVATRDELLEALRSCVHPGDVVLLKGARAYALEEILKGFD